MAMTGYNPEVVRNSINQFETAYSHYNDAMNTGLQNNFVNEMANVWACEQAQSFFTKAYKPSIDALYNSVEASLASVVNTMNAAAREWAVRTESEFSPIAHTQIPNAANVDGIKVEIGGEKGIDLEVATSTVGKLASIKANAEAALDEAKNAVATCGFLGGEQQSSITNSLGKIKQDATKFIDDLTGGIKASIDNTVTAYGNLAAKNSDSFTAKGE